MDDQAPPPPPNPPHPEPSLVEAITDAVHDGNDSVLRRLLARFAEQATITDLYTLRDALDTRLRPHWSHRRGLRR